MQHYTAAQIMDQFEAGFIDLEVALAEIKHIEAEREAAEVKAAQRVQDLKDTLVSHNSTNDRVLEACRRISWGARWQPPREDE